MVSVLVVEDDPGIRGCISRSFAKRMTVTMAATIAEASAIIRSGIALRGAVLDLVLPDGSGLDLLEQIRPHYPDLPVTILSGHLEHDIVNRAFKLGAHYLVKPLSADDLERLASWFSHMGTLDVSPSRLAERFALTPRESELLALSLGGFRRDVIRARLGVRESTIKKTVARLLRKFEVGSLREIAEVIATEESENGRS